MTMICWVDDSLRNRYSKSGRIMVHGEEHVIGKFRRTDYNVNEVYGWKVAGGKDGE